MSDAPDIDDFRDLTLIGRGTSGTVYRARQESMNRDVAIKVLQASTTDPNARERFGREVRTLGELSGHPAIVTTYTSGVTADDRPYLVMDLMESDLSRRAPISVAEAVEVITAAANGLAEAHRRGVLHRDIKPANIFRDRFEQIRLGDFGLVGLSEAQSITNASVGSPAYMAPELLTSSKASVSSDLYALAVTLYWFIEGSLPFEAGDAGVAGLFHAIISTPHRPPARMGPRLRAFIDRCLAKDPALRPQSAAEFSAELAVAVASDGQTDVTETPDVAPAPVAPPPPSAPVFAHTTSGGGQLISGSSGGGSALPPPAPPAGAHPGGESHPPPAPRRPSRSRRWLIPLAVVALVAAGGGGYVVLSGDDGAGGAGVESAVVAIRSSVLSVPQGAEDALTSRIESSGFLIDDGYIVTGRAAGVAEDVQVTIGGEDVDAELVGTSDCTGVSVLRVDPDDVADSAPMPWSTGRIGFGNSVRLLGHDRGEYAVFDTEVVTQPGRIVDGTSVHEVQYDLDFVAPGDAIGGPVLDRDDAVAGMVVSVNSADDSSRTLSVLQLEPIVDEIIARDGDLGLGISFREAGGSISVRSVRPGSLGAAVGLEPGDEIIDIDDVGLSIADEPLVDFCEIISDIGSGEIPLRVRRDQGIYVGAIGGDELERESNTELDYHEIASDDGSLIVEVPVSWEVFDDPSTADYDGAVLSAQGPDGFIEYSVQPFRTPQEIVDLFIDVFADTPECTPGDPVEYVDGVFTGLEMPVTCTDQPDAVNTLIAATEDQSGDSIALLYSYDGPAAEEVVSQIESTFLLLGN